MARLDVQALLERLERLPLLPVPEIGDPEIAEQVGVEELPFHRLLAQLDSLLRPAVRHHQRQAEIGHVLHPGVLGPFLALLVDGRLEGRDRFQIQAAIHGGRALAEGFVGRHRGGSCRGHCASQVQSVP